jgi:hypothetical protein
MYSVSLYHYASPDIRISISANFDGEKLVIEGYDIGKTVDDFFGDSDYEYSMSIPEEEVIKLYPLFNVPQGEKIRLLEALKERFHTNTCFSEISEFLSNNNIKCRGFSWA